MLEESRLGRLHSNLWCFHDEQNWQQLKKTAINFIIELGYPKALATKVAPHVVGTFQAADMAFKAQQNANAKTEQKYDSAMAKEFELVHKLLSVETDSIGYKIKWIRASRHNEFSNVLLNLFMEHLKRFGLKKFFLAIACTFYAIFKIYPAHNKHNWKMLSKHFTTYWHLIKQSFEASKHLPPQF